MQNVGQPFRVWGANAAPMRRPGVDPTTGNRPLPFAAPTFRMRRASVMNGPTWRWLQNRLDAMERTMLRRENVIRFLVGRAVLMLAMVVGFLMAMR